MNNNSIHKHNLGLLGGKPWKLRNVSNNVPNFLRQQHHQLFFLRVSAMYVFLFFSFVSTSFADTPKIVPFSDHRAAQGTRYEKTPLLSQGSSVIWQKEYGPDDMNVDAFTGRVTWRIPDNLPGESFHIGVRATNSEGSDIDVWILTVGDGNVIYVGPSETYTTISAGTAAMSAGDTLIVRDGVYTGPENIMYNENSRGTLPPIGSASAYTTAMAETPGGVLLDGEGVRRPIRLYGSWADRSGHTPLGAYDASYIAFKGFVVGNTSTGGAIYTNHVHHIKFIDCGAYNAMDNSAPFSINRSNYVLIEGGYAWGRGRMSFLFYYCDHVIVRRSVARHDVSFDTNPMGVFDLYACQYSRIQNSIAVDSVLSYSPNRSGVVGAFINQAGSANSYATLVDNLVTHSIALNHEGRFTWTQNNPGDTPTYSNCVGWDIKAQKSTESNTTAGNIIGGSDDILINQCTFGRWTSPVAPLYSGLYFNGWTQTDSITNSIIFDLKDYDGNSAAVFYEYEIANYNNIYNTGTLAASGPSPTNTITANPMLNGLKYITRIEPRTNLQTAGLSASRVGADLSYMKGKSGTMWGDSGYDDETTTPMWPFPGENLIQEKFKAYSYDGGGLTGNRGFCVTGQSLTNYVWGYLDNTPPPFNVKALPMNQSVTLTWTPPADFSRSTITEFRIYDVTGGNPKLVGTVSGNSLFTYTVTELTNNSNYDFIVTAVDNTKGESGYSYKVSVTPAATIAATTARIISQQ